MPRHPPYSIALLSDDVLSALIILETGTLAHPFIWNVCRRWRSLLKRCILDNMIAVGDFPPWFPAVGMGSVQLVDFYLNGTPRGYRLKNEPWYSLRHCSIDAVDSKGRNAVLWLRNDDCRTLKALLDNHIWLSKMPVRDTLTDLDPRLHPRRDLYREWTTTVNALILDKRPSAHLLRMLADCGVEMETGRDLVHSFTRRRDCSRRNWEGIAHAPNNMWAAMAFLEPKALATFIECVRREMGSQVHFLNRYGPTFYRVIKKLVAPTNDHVSMHARRRFCGDRAELDIIAAIIRGGKLGPLQVLHAEPLDVEDRCVMLEWLSVLVDVEGSAECILLLMENGADPFWADDKGITPFGVISSRMGNMLCPQWRGDLRRLDPDIVAKMNVMHLFLGDDHPSIQTVKRTLNFRGYMEPPWC